MPHESPPHNEAPQASPDALPSAPLPPLARRPGFSAAELSAAARVIEHQVKLANARHTPAPP